MESDTAPVFFVRVPSVYVVYETLPSSGFPTFNVEYAFLPATWSIGAVLQHGSCAAGHAVDFGFDQYLWSSVSEIAMRLRILISFSIISSIVKNM